MRDINSMRLNFQFKRMYSKGSSAASPYVVLYAKKTNRKSAFGITASKKTGNAVSRNRAKRRLRAIYRKFRHRIKENYDIVAVARAKTSFCDYQKLESAFLRLCGELDILKKEAEAESEAF